MSGDATIFEILQKFNLFDLYQILIFWNYAKQTWFKLKIFKHELSDTQKLWEFMLICGDVCDIITAETFMQMNICSQ